MLVKISKLKFKIPKPWSIFFSALLMSARRFHKEDYAYRASALTYTTLLALVPLVSVVIALVGHFPAVLKIVELAQSYVLNELVPTSGDAIQYYLKVFTDQAMHLPMVGILFLFLTATLLIYTVEETFDHIWQSREKKQKFLAWLLYWAVLLLAPLAIGLSVFLSTLLFSLSWFEGVAIIKTPLLAIMSIAINIALFSLLYIIVPSAPVKVRNGLMGGVLAALLFEIAKKLFAFYIHKFANYTLIYGALSTIPIFLVWVYISWFIVLYGALFTNAISQVKKREEDIKIF
ncbi:MAG: YihY family inner membrane protein [Pseudomonadota bacterium]